jgi:hypothetical protein
VQHSSIISFLISMLEIFRRGIWVRIEHLLHNVYFEVTSGASMLTTSLGHLPSRERALHQRRPLSSHQANRVTIPRPHPVRRARPYRPRSSTRS